MLSTNTAVSGQSVWDEVCRKKFQDHVDALHRENFVSGSQVLAEADWPEPSENDALPFGVEKRLADDFSFIAACEYGVQYVTATTIVPASTEHPGLTIRLAANEGVRKHVELEIKDVLSIIEKCANKVISRDRCEEELFDVVVKLNRNKILGRLVSSHFKKPAYPFRPPHNPLSVRLKEGIELAIQKSAPQANLQELFDQTDAFHDAFLRLEGSSAKETVELAKTTIKAAFRITKDGFSLLTRLEALGVQTSHMNRDVREVIKVSNYWRICHVLAHLSRVRVYRRLFANLHLETLPPYQVSLKQGTNRFVHAEIQMIVFYEKSSSGHWPRAIGVSKDACFLCNSFVKAHGYFYLSKAHCQLYHQWTVPDLKEYNTNTLQRLRTALVAVDKDVLKTLSEAQRERIFKPYPLQSSVDLGKFSLPAASSTTASFNRDSVRAFSSTGSSTLSHRTILGPRTTQHDPKASSADEARACEEFVSARPMNRPSPCLPKSASGESIAKNVRTKESDLLKVEEVHSSRFRDFTVPPMVTSSTVHAVLDWLSIYVCLERSRSYGNGTSTPTSKAPAFSRPSVRLDTVQDCRQVENCIDIASLVPGEELVLTRTEERNVSSSEPEVEFILGKCSSNPVRVRCKWHTE